MKLNRISYALIAPFPPAPLPWPAARRRKKPWLPRRRSLPSLHLPRLKPPAPVSATSITVGNTAAADKSVAAVSTYGVKDKIIVSVKTDVATPANAAIDAKLTYQDGQVAGQQTATVVAEDAGTTNVTFANTNPWPAGKYTIVVTLNGQPVGLAQDIEVK